MTDGRGEPASLAGRVALISGASSGLGEGFARRLAACGAKVVLTGRRLMRLNQVAAEIHAAGGTALGVEMDVTSEASTIAAYDRATDAFGTVDTIVANAGINHFGLALSQPIEDFDAVIAANLRGVFLTAREGARRLIADGSAEREHGRIVLISSITANVVDGGLSAYSASKAAIVQMGKVLAKEWVRKGVNVNMLCPGYTMTEINRPWFETEAGQRQIAAFNRRRLMNDESIDAPLIFLCSDAARGVTGATLTVDDGQSL